MDEEIHVGRVVSERVLAAVFPPEPEGAAVAIDRHGHAYQRQPRIPFLSPEGEVIVWTPTHRPDAVHQRGRTWRELHADGPVIVAWDPCGRDRTAAAALGSYEEVPDAAS